MKRYMLIVLSNPKEGQEEEFKRWYLEQHIPDCLRVPGFVSGKLLPAAGQQPSLQKEKRWNYRDCSNITEGYSYSTNCVCWIPERVFTIGITVARPQT